MSDELCEDAFLEGAMERYGDAVYRLALCRLGSRADAEDVYQDVFLRLLRDTTAFRDGEHLKAWLLRVTLHCCVDLRRSAWWKRTAPLEAAADAAAPLSEEKGALWQAVEALPADLRTAVWLHYVEGYGTDRYAWLVIVDKGQTLTQEEAAAKVAISAADSVVTITPSFDVNRTGKVDVNDAQLVYDMYNGTYSNFTQVSVEKFLRADVNATKVVDHADAVAIVNQFK